MKGKTLLKIIYIDFTGSKSAEIVRINIIEKENANDVTRMQNPVSSNVPPAPEFLLVGALASTYWSMMTAGQRLPPPLKVHICTTLRFKIIMHT
jgi:hypothetical protein